LFYLGLLEDTTAKAMSYSGAAQTSVADAVKSRLAEDLEVESWVEGAEKFIQRGLASVSAVPPEKWTNDCALGPCVAMLNRAHILEHSGDLKTSQKLFREARTCTKNCFPGEDREAVMEAITKEITRLTKAQNRLD
jgi:hypothetical protein